MKRINYRHCYGTGNPCVDVEYVDGAVTTRDCESGEVRGTFTLTDGALVGTGGPSTSQKERIALHLVQVLAMGAE